MNTPRLFTSEIKNNKASPHKEIQFPSKNASDLIIQLVIDPKINANLVNNDPNPDPAAGIVRIQIGEEAGQPIVLCVDVNKKPSIQTQHAIGHIAKIDESGTFLGGNVRVEQAVPGKKGNPTLAVVFVPDSCIEFYKKQLLDFEKGRQAGYEQGHKDGLAQGYEQGRRDASVQYQQQLQTHQQMQQMYMQQMQNIQQMQATLAAQTMSVAFTDGVKARSTIAAPAPVRESDKDDSIRFGLLEPVPVVVKLEEQETTKTQTSKVVKVDQKEEKVVYETTASDKCENGGHLGEACDCAHCQERQTHEFLAAEAADDREFPKLGTTPPKKEAWELELEQEQRLAAAMASAKKAEEKLQEEARLAKMKADREAVKLPKPKHMSYKTFIADKEIKQQKQREMVDLASQISKGEGRDYAEQLQERIQKMYGVDVPHLELYSRKTTPAEVKKFLVEHDTPLDCNIKVALKAYNGLVAAFKEAHPFLDQEQIQLMHENFGKLAKLIDEVGTTYRVTWAKALYSIVKPTLTDLGYKQWAFSDY